MGGLASVLWCATCNLTPTPRARHCTFCNKCVEVFDHHCIWVNTCIGRKNHRRFYAYIVAQLTLVIYALHHIIRDAKLGHRRFWGATQTYTTLLLVFLVVSCLFLAGLAIFHAFLIFTNQTTFEITRYSRSKGPLGTLSAHRGVRRTYNKGCLRNIFLFATDSDDFFYAPGSGEDCLLDHPVCHNQWYSFC